LYMWSCILAFFMCYGRGALSPHFYFWEGGGLKPP
jgi:hypothetical protein